MPSSDLFVSLLTNALPILIIIAAAAYSIRILREYERGVVFQLGRFWKVKGPGLVLVIPFIQQMVRMDMRTRVLDVPPQDVISKDNVSVKVNAVVYFRVLDAEKAVIQVEEFQMATSQFAQTTLRSVLGQHDLDQMLSEREKLNVEVQRILDERTDAWGIKVSNVELKHIDLNESMIRAIAKPNGCGAPRSSMRRESFRPPKGWRKLVRYFRSAPRRCSCATSEPCSTSRERRTQRSYFRCR